MPAAPVTFKQLIHPWIAARTRPWSWLTPLVVVVGALLAFVGGIMGQDHKTKGDFAWIAVGVVGTLVVVAHTILKEWATGVDADGARDEASRFRVTLHNALQPLTERISRMPPLTPVPRKQELQTVAVEVASALHLILNDVEDVRAIVYRLDPTGSQMSPMAYYGRGANAPSPFVAGTPRGDAAIKLVLDAGELFEEDVQAVNSPAYAGSTSGYRTFISVAIYDQTEAYGMLTVDAPEPGALVTRDVHLVQVVARLLAIAFAVAK